jgi:hypothetical protein
MFKRICYIAAMVASEQHPDESTCWQCGQPADPTRPHVERLAAWGHGHDHLGYPLISGRRQEVLDVSIPRCSACYGRNRRTGWMTLAGAVVGIACAAMMMGGKGGAIFVGFVLGSFLFGALGNLYDKLAGRRILTSYPPLRYLLRHGWHYQGSA